MGHLHNIRKNVLPYLMTRRKNNYTELAQVMYESFLLHLNAHHNPLAPTYLLSTPSPKRLIIYTKTQTG